MDRITRTTATRIAVLALALLIAGSLAGCAGGQSTGGVTTSSVSSGYDSGTAPELSVPAPATEGLTSAEPSKGGAGESSVGVVEKLIVINKTVRIETKDVDAAIEKIRALTDRDGGDIASMQVSTSNDEPIYPLAENRDTYSGSSVSTQLKAYVTVRVPSAKFKAFVSDVMKLGTVLYQSESTDDVTQQHVDMQARLENMKAEQARLRQLFDKATKVSDMLAIEQELTRVQGEIESMQAQITYLENQAAMATVTIELKEPTPVVSPSGIDWGTQTAFTEAVRAFVGTMNGIIVLLGPALALLVFVGLPALLVVWIVRRSVKRRRAKKVAASPATTAPPAAPETTEPKSGA